MASTSSSSAESSTTTTTIGMLWGLSGTTATAAIPWAPS